MHWLGHCHPRVALRYQRATADRADGDCAGAVCAVANASVVPLTSAETDLTANREGHAAGQEGLVGYGSDVQQNAVNCGSGLPKPSGT